MSEATVQDAEVVKEAGPIAPVVSPAKDIREIQALLVQGIFPGNVAPTVVKAFNLLENMAQIVEKASAGASGANQAK